MRLNRLIAGVVLPTIALHSLAVSPNAAATSSSVATPGSASTSTSTSTSTVVGGSNSAGKSGASGASGAGASRGSLLCAGLLGSGFLGNVLTVAPLPVTPKSDPNTAIQFTRIWSDSQHATVGGQPPVPVSHAVPVVAVVKLPITFSAADRQKFEDAGWKRREQAIGNAVSYCLESTGQSNAAGSSKAQGMICVSADPVSAGP